MSRLRCGDKLIFKEDKNTRKFMSILLALVLVFSLFGCAAEEPVKEAPAATEAPAEEPTEAPAEESTEEAAE